MAEGKKLLEEDPTLKRIVETIVEVLDPDVIILFGSRARGDYDEKSDYDLLVLKEGIKPEERRRLQWKVRRALLEKGLYSLCDIDVIVQSPERFKTLRGSRYMVYFWAYKEGKILYEKQRSGSLA